MRTVVKILSAAHASRVATPVRVTEQTEWRWSREGQSGSWSTSDGRSGLQKPASLTACQRRGDTCPAAGMMNSPRSLPSPLFEEEFAGGLGLRSVAADR